MNSMFDIEKIGSSWDDAGWEAFDKAAKMMWLEYPGWPIISKLANDYELEWWKSKDLFPRVWLVKREFNFSFSGLKSSVKREVDKRIEQNWELTLEDKKEISYEFENAVTEVMAWKLVEAARQKWVKTVMLAGWVSANTKLKIEIEKLAHKEWLKFIYPIKNLYCMDNAAMVGINTYYKIKYNKYEEKIWVVKM
jgi:N6-L-threonylcarbamoyladenine synthase